jgi:hypothetical protein
MTIKFQTKEESKREQEQAFLKLTPAERVWRFFWLCHTINRLPRKEKEAPSENLILIRKHHE